MGDGSGIYEEPCFYCKQFNPSPNEEQREITRMLTALDELTAEGTDERRVHLAGGFTEARTA